MLIYLGKLLFKGYLPINTNFQRPKNNSKIERRNFLIRNLYSGTKRYYEQQNTHVQPMRTGYDLNPAITRALGSISAVFSSLVLAALRSSSSGVSAGSFPEQRLVIEPIRASVARTTPGQWTIHLGPMTYFQELRPLGGSVSAICRIR